jgi:CO/xanthine dehydrogenase Mo-binding subunit
MALTSALPPTARIDGLDKVTGAATYAADITRPGMLWARVLRSSLPHARVLSVDTERAKALPGVRAVLTGRDLPDYRVGRSMRDMPVLARDKVRFIGEKVAAVAAESLEVAEEALNLIEVEYEELEAVFDPVEATRPGAPLIHDPELVRAWKTPRQQPADYPNSVSMPVVGASLDELDAAMARADHVFEHTFRTPVQHQGYIEPHAALVELDQRGVAHIWASNKAPFLLLNYLEWGLGLTQDQVQVHMLPLGGDFGGKGSFMDIPLVYLLAKETGRPVKMVMSYTEELMAANPRHAAVVVCKTGFDRDGRMLAHLSRTYYASGGYAAFKPAPDATLPGARGGGLSGYEIPVKRIEGHMVYTNTVPGGHMRAPGEAQPMHAMECHLDLCARKLGIDPLELRLRNAPAHVRTTPDGKPGPPPRAREVMLKAAEAIGWHERTADPDSAVLCGKGLALVEVENSPGDYAAEMTVRRDGTIILHTPIIENGAGMLTVFRQMAAEAWGVPLDQVRVEQTTHGFTYDRGVGGSRITRVVSRMINELSQHLQVRLADLVADEFGQQRGGIAFEQGGFLLPDGRTLSVAEAATIAPDDLLEHLEHKADRADIGQVWVSQAAEVEVDRETGQVRVCRVVTAHEVGRIVHPVLHQGQIDGGLIQGFGYAVTEGLVINEGRVMNLNLHEYKLPSIADIPQLDTILLPEDHSLGITPIGEGPNCGMSACIVNAIVDAIGRPVQIDIPIDPDLVRRLVQSP